METIEGIGTQPALEERSGVSQSHISRLLLCQAAATTDVLVDLARACRCQPWELLVDEDEVRREALARMLGR